MKTIFKRELDYNYSNPSDVQVSRCFSTLYPYSRSRFLIEQISSDNTYSLIVWEVRDRSYKEKKIHQSVKDLSGVILQAYFGGEISQDEIIEQLDAEWHSKNRN